jgi:hypothetical protein
MSAEPSTESPAAAVGSALADGSAGAAARRAALPRTERELNSPSPLTMGLLGVVFLATFFPWVAAKLACNGREPPPRSPPELTLDVLARQPKDAALELQQRVATGHYREAAELARGDAARELQEAEARCQSDPKPCEALRASSRAVTTRAVLVGRGPLLAEARVESQRGDQSERYVVKLQAEGPRWYVIERKPFAGDLLTPVPVVHLAPGAFASPHGIVPTHGTVPSPPRGPVAPQQPAPAAPR